MNNQDDGLDKILDELSFNGINDVDYCPGGHKLEKYAREEAKAAITSLIKELVEEAKPSKKHVGDEVAENRSYTGERLFNATIDEYHSNLLKALEEV